jgi:flagellar biosynthetic protein FlhB
MLADVQNADVVTTNPQHYAVAIRYDAKDMRAPKVLARGTDQLALTIRRIAQAHGIPIFEHPPLARALYHTTDVGQEISPRLYFAVAQVLTYVFQLTGRMPAGPSGQPVRPNPDIEDDLLVPARERRRAQRTLST